MSHYYERLDDGAVVPRHFVPMSTREGERPTRITDVKKAWKAGKLWVPSVTTVLAVLAKPALTRWLIDQHLKQAYFMRDNLADEDAFIRDVKRETDAEMAKAPDAGTDMHKALENYIGKGFEPEPSMRGICYDAKEKLDEMTGGLIAEFQDYWDCERYFVSPLGYGGCMDLVSDFSSGIVGDWKSKQTADKFKPGKMAYDEHAMQLAAYRRGVGLPNARCFNGFVCLETGEIDIHWHTPEALERGWLMFHKALELWQLQNDWPDLQEAA